MEINNLMIDDLVQEWNNDHTETHIIRIEKLMREGVYDKYNHFHDADWIEPIPLTTEILEKNGFQKQQEERGFSEPYTVYVNDDYRLSIKIYPKGIMDRYHHLYIGDYDDDPFISLYINYVHELQHALRLVRLNEVADNLKSRIKMALPTAMGMDYESIQKLNDVRPYEFETDRERKWYQIGLIDGAEAADMKNNDTCPITVDFLKKNFDDCSAAHRNIFVTTKKQTPISVVVFGVNGMTWKVCIGNNEVYIKTVGQLKAFLRMFSLDEFANNLKY